jgi:hypothetical protein
MADFTVNSGSNPGHFLSGANSPRLQYFQESTAVSTAVIKAGDIVSNDTVTAGKFRIVRAPAGGGNGANILATTNVLGVAMEASTSDGSTSGLDDAGSNRRIGVAVAEPNAEFVGYLIGSNNVTGSSLIGTNKAVRYDSTNHIYAIDSTNSTSALLGVQITGIPNGTDGSTNGPVVFRFLSTWTSPIVRQA